jgi:hypothetical protein
LLTKTSGPRDDISAKFSALNPQHVAFSGLTARVTCSRDDRLQALAIGPTGSINTIGYIPVSGC